MGPSNSIYLLNTTIFHFHDYGRKSILVDPGVTPFTSISGSATKELQLRRAASKAADS